MKPKCTTVRWSSVGCNESGTCGGAGRDLPTVEVPQGILRSIPFRKSALQSIVILGRISCSGFGDTVSGGGVMETEFLSELGDGRPSFFLEIPVSTGSPVDLASLCRLAL